MPSVEQYEREDGSVPFADWFDSLPAQPAAKITSVITRMEKGNFGDNPSVGGGVRERKINFQKGYRIYYAMDGNDLVLLFWGGTKHRQQNDVDKAKQLWREYKSRKWKLAREAKGTASKKAKPRGKK
jgi:putative addiction module killer protein